MLSVQFGCLPAIRLLRQACEGSSIWLDSQRLRTRDSRQVGKSKRCQLDPADTETSLCR